MKYNFNEKDLFDLFVDRDNDIQPMYNNPYQRDGYVYATDGKKLIRIKENAVRGNYETTDKMKLDFPIDNCDYTVSDKDVEKFLSKLPHMDEMIAVGNNVKCPECDGEGTVTWKYTDKDWNDHELEEDCPVCEGSGYIEKVRPEKTGRKLPILSFIVKVGSNNMLAAYLQTLLDAMRIIGVSEVRLVAQDKICNHFRIDENISIMLASNTLSADYKINLKQGGEQ